MKIIKVHISTIGTGDTILHNNKMVTVNSCNIKKDDFMGISIFGDSYFLGNKQVQKIILNK